MRKKGDQRHYWGKNCYEYTELVGDHLQVEFVLTKISNLLLFEVSNASKKEHIAENKFWGKYFMLIM